MHESYGRSLAKISWIRNNFSEDFIRELSQDVEEVSENEIFLKSEKRCITQKEKSSLLIFRIVRMMTLSILFLTAR
jgi:hypothetical protein